MELVKEEVAVMNRDLSILISCYHQLQLQGANVENQTSRDNTVYESRRNEVCLCYVFNMLYILYVIIYIT